MPAGRILLKSISESRKLAALKTDGARLLYTWLIPHLDINGCFSGDPRVIKGKIFTRLAKTTRSIQSFIDDLQRVGLVIIYYAKDDIFLQVPDFAERQPTLNPEREGKPSIPPPTHEQLKSKSRPTQDKPNTSKVKESKVNNTSILFDYFNQKLKEMGWIKRSLQLTYQRKRLIESRLKDYSLDDLKKCVDNFVQDDWPDRHKYIDLKYCIGIVRGIDNAERWINAKKREKHWNEP